MTANSPRILFLFSGATNREKALGEIAAGVNADTALRGMNHIPGAEHLDVEETVRSIVPAWLYRLLPWHARSILLYARARRADAVVAQDDLLLGWVISVAARLFGTRTRWVAIAVNSSTLIRRHAAHPLRLFWLTTFWKSFARIVCISHEQVEDFAKVGVSRDRLVFIPFGIDAEFFAPSAGAEGGDLIVSVGRDLGRDYPTLLAAAEKSSHPFVIVAAHKNLSATTPLPENVSVRYNLPPAEVRDLYARARLVVIASKDAEVPEGSDCSGQTVILDAMAAGRPVIATARPWIVDYFTPDEEIVVVAPGDPVALAAAIERLWRETVARERLARAGCVRVAERYTTKAFAAALTTLIATL